MKTFPHAGVAVAALKPQNPVICLRPHAIKKAVTWFQQHFKGHALYAVKANNDPVIIQHLYDNGLRHFDVAALEEIKQLSHFPDVQLYYMNPFKPRWMIKQAYHNYGVRDFVLDSQSELLKIVAETTTDPAALNLHVRLAIPNPNAAVPLAGKFGIALKEAATLLQETARYTNNLGISFHVGSQCLDPESYRFAIQLVDQILDHITLPLRSLDIGGGFPVHYDNYSQPKSLAFMTAIFDAQKHATHLKDCTLLAEPGRALVAEAESLIVQIIHRGNQTLTLNDGAFGTMFEGSEMYYGLVYPVRPLTVGGKAYNKAIPCEMLPFSLQGPTCDSTDTLSGTYILPADIDEGDYIEIGNTGAYGHVLSSHFNGFGRYDRVILSNNPMYSRY